jgi:DNA (cytosine-5)-methyltransferase 1
MPRKFKAISLFSGAGGMDIGVMQAGFEILACVEFDPYACETLRANISREKRKTKVFETDIRKVNPDELMAELGLQPGELDLLCGGPPCQAFSQIGKRHSLQDERGLLLFEMTRFAKAFRPRTILIEQVKGLLNAEDEQGKPGGVFDLLLKRLEKLEYGPKWKVVNAGEYGVPQLRQRVFIVSTEKPNGFQFPPPTHSASKKDLPLFPLPPYITVGEALEGLGKPYKQNGYIPENSHLDVTPDGDRYRINGVPEGSHLAAQLHLPKEQRCNLTKKDTTKFKRLSRYLPSNTLRCGEIFFHPQENRYLTPREYMRIHGYPDDYILKGPIRGRSGRVRHLDQHRQVANSVPPPVARILAKEIIKTLYAKNLRVIRLSDFDSVSKSTAVS